jgi:hypothetical protein
MKTRVNKMFYEGKGSDHQNGNCRGEQTKHDGLAHFFSVCAQESQINGQGYESRRRWFGKGAWLIIAMLRRKLHMQMLGITQQKNQDEYLQL